ncbi:hypothetical protein ACFQ45_03850 [Rhodanobacter aciditrophus]|uniref:Fis family transcriptional regulator n=1 Tax=Rhodanobacter aciditrophus TaxID=1623218 RepID=A0ABW4AY63_9GAMM
MRKSDKKIEKQLRDALNQVCDQLLEENIGFQWVTHLVDYDRFPASLKIICIFETEAAMSQYQASQGFAALPNLVNRALENHQIVLKNLKKHLFFDNEEACARTHEGNWAARLKRF